MGIPQKKKIKFIQSAKLHTHLHHPSVLIRAFFCCQIINISTIRTQIYLHVYYLSHKKSTNKTEESIYLSIHRLSNKSVIQKAINTRIYTYV